MSNDTMPPKRSRSATNPRLAKAYLSFKSDLAELVGWYDGGGDCASKIIAGLENLVHYEFDTVLTKEMMQYAYCSATKSDLLALLKKLRTWTAIKHASIWDGENYHLKEKCFARQAAADSVKMTFYDMYSYILKTSRDIENNRPSFGAFDQTLSKRGRFARDSEFDLYAKSAEVEDSESADADDA